jgi:multidrug transporter EmrE-like cation transporter
MKTLGFIIAATVFEAIGDAVMRIALHYHAMPSRLFLFVLAILLLTMYGASLNLAPIEFAEATGMYIGSLFIAFQVVNYAFFHQKPSPAVLVGGAFILTGAVIISVWK